MTGFSVRTLTCPPDPMALFSGIRHLPGSFLLHSAPGFANHRYSVFSALPLQTEQREPGQPAADCIDAMIARLTLHATRAQHYPLPGWYGLLGYELQTLIPTSPGTHGLPALRAGFYPVVFVVDHACATVSCIALEGFSDHADHLIADLQNAKVETASFQLTQPFTSNMTRDHYGDCFAKVQAYLHAGDCYQVNLAQRFHATCSGDSWAAFQQLCTALPAPMAAYFSQPDFECLSLSPERFLAISDGKISTHPIKGTRPRHQDAERDRQSASELQASEKDRAENLMIVDLLRNDLGLSCVPGSIRVTDLFAIESYANVHHMVSRIEGQLRPEIHPLKALLAAFPGGSITGAPKKRAMEIIAELEPDSRLFYCGSAFYCDVGGRLDSSILIRSLVRQNENLYCWGGGGIVADSTADSEYQETLHKVGVILRTLEGMETSIKS